ILPGVGPAKAERSFQDPEGADAEFAKLMLFLRNPETPWPGQVQRVREWYEPHLERIYDQARVRAGDLLQLERIATGFSSREAFLSELALDPPAASGDESGAPYLDEDYLIL